MNRTTLLLTTTCLFGAFGLVACDSTDDVQTPSPNKTESQPSHQEPDGASVDSDNNASGKTGIRVDVDDGVDVKVGDKVNVDVEDDGVNVDIDRGNKPEH